MTDRNIIAVTGANGFLGRAVVAYLANHGRAVRAVVRDDPGGWPDGVTVDQVTSLDAEVARPGVALTDVACVVHCAARAHVLRETAGDPLAAFRAVNRDITVALARAAAAAGVARFIFISSIGVNGAETQGRGYRADDEPAPHSPYAISKHEAERGLAMVARDTGLEVVIIRPPLVIGADPKGNLGTLVRAVARGLPLPLGAVTRNRRDLVTPETLASLIDVCIHHPAAAGQTFLVSDGHPRSTRDIVTELARLSGVKARMVPLPPALLGAGLRALGRASLASQLLGDLEVHIGHTIDTLGWHPPQRLAKPLTAKDRS